MALAEAAVPPAAAVHAPLTDGDVPYGNDDTCDGWLSHGYICAGVEDAVEAEGAYPAKLLLPHLP